MLQIKETTFFSQSQLIWNSLIDFFLMKAIFQEEKEKNFLSILGFTLNLS